ncbi:undecaprenyl-diphosphatase UppP [Thermodesulfatator autotrophicus]|uniref:Undecaprenyl-diphosphatase n=1 Tax=Thermodesulfatator autotrophicus TaxID=1795632 RepID=A0A177E647_9BACT|nr:undecaprenyl-diphosphatase UppP [Thermodesulfatator autotrophicus]OAG27427.1 hypothetical protein TH606_07090 [Thermodesulfatator autotrophicus]
MTYLEAIALGVLQGITEFLPISSSGHLILAEKFFNIKGTSLTFDVFLHMGTLLAVLIYFWQDWRNVLSFKRDEKNNPRLIFYLALATIPGVIAGLLLEDAVATVFRSAERVAFMLVFMSLPMILAEIFSRQKASVYQLNLSKALVIGCAQALAVIPGTSRSGITMSAGMLVGLKRPEAARFSFLLSAPIIAGAGLYEALKVWQGGEHFSIVYVIGFLASFISGIAVIAWLLRFLRAHTFYPFVIYRILLAAFIFWRLNG